MVMPEMRGKYLYWCYCLWLVKAGLPDWVVDVLKKVSVIFVGRQESGIGGGKEEKTSIRTGCKNHC